MIIKKSEKYIDLNYVADLIKIPTPTVPTA